ASATHFSTSSTRQWLADRVLWGLLGGLIQTLEGAQPALRLCGQTRIVKLHLPTINPILRTPTTCDHDQRLNRQISNPNQR
ncbi:MAG: hypothetical protein L6R39_000885, partial [Caloplaca ligustica]